MSAIYYYEPSYTIDRLFDHFCAPRSNGQQETNEVAKAFKPRMDLHENKETNTVTATFELPGLKKEDVNIDVHDGRLTISAETTINSENNEDGYAVRERRYGKFSRTLRLPQGVNSEDIKASLEHGLLTVTFPKSVPEAAAKKITIG